MTARPPTRAMRANADLDQLRRQAKELLDAYREQRPEAVAEVTAYHAAAPDTFALHDAQFVLARAYGFESWPKLMAAVGGVTETRLHDAVERGDLESARALLVRRPEIVDLGRGEMRALHMAVLRRDLPMTTLLLEFGADTEGGIWPNRDATGPYVIARDRGYDEILDAIRQAREQRGGRGPGGPNEATRTLLAAFPARLGVPVGTNRTGRVVPGAWSGSRGGRRRELGHAARLGREDAARGDRAAARRARQALSLGG